MGVEAASIAKKPRLRYESGEVPMVLPIDPNDEPNKHMNAQVSLDRAATYYRPAYIGDEGMRSEITS